MSLFVLLFTSFAVCLLFKQKIEETIPFSCFFQIIVLYIFGLCGLLLQGVYFNVIISIVSFAYCAWNFKKNKQLIFNNAIRPGLLIFVCVFLWGCLAHHNRLFTSWDEFSHWGLVVKNMVMLDWFGNHPDATTQFKGYPPATALFQYFYCKLSGTYHDSNVIRSMNLLSLSLLLPIVKLIKWNEKLLIFLVALIISILPLQFYPGFFNVIYVDPMLGLLFAYILYCYFSSERPDLFCLLNLVLAGSVFSLVKASGFGLALIALAIIAIDTLVFRRETAVFGRLNHKIARILFVALPFCSIVLTKYSWSLYLKVTNTAPAWSGLENTPIKTFFQLIMLDAPEYRYRILYNFVVHLVSGSLGAYMFKMTFILWIGVFSIVAMAALYLLRGDPLYARMKVALYGLFAGSLIYTMMLLLLYMFTFSEYEGVRLASINRYLSTYLLGMLTFLVFLILYVILQKPKLKSKTQLVLIVLIGLLFVVNVKPLRNVTIRYPADLKRTQAIRAPYEGINKIQMLLNRKTDRLYFISQNSDGFDYWVARYNLTPIKTEPSFEWSIGTPYGDSDVWTKRITCDEWTQQLSKQYTYVYLYKVDKQFKDEFKKSFLDIEAIGNDKLYKIENVGGEIKLVNIVF